MKECKDVGDGGVATRDDFDIITGFLVLFKKLRELFRSRPMEYCH
jgi:hypothetical protein